MAEEEGVVLVDIASPTVKKRSNLASDLPKSAACSNADCQTEEEKAGVFSFFKFCSSVKEAAEMLFHSSQSPASLRLDIPAVLPRNVPECTFVGSLEGENLVDLSTDSLGKWWTPRTKIDQVND